MPKHATAASTKKAARQAAANLVASGSRPIPVCNEPHIGQHIANPIPQCNKRPLADRLGDVVINGMPLTCLNELLSQDKEQLDLAKVMNRYIPSAWEARHKLRPVPAYF